jgi:tRNA1Val (adenine37-N6)-methyltransferase
VLLAGLTNIKREDRIIELGTGCGVIPLVLAWHARTKNKITGLEIQPELADLAVKNVSRNNFEDLIEVLRMDFREAPSRFDPESFDVVLSNPPYRKPGAGRINPDRQKALARHEITATVEDVFAAASYLLKTRGRIAIIYPSTRLANLIRSALLHGFSPKRMTLIYSYPHGPARLIHLECLKGGGEELKVAEPFYVYDENGNYSDEMSKFY